MAKPTSQRIVRVSAKQRQELEALLRRPSVAAGLAKTGASNLALSGRMLGLRTGPPRTKATPPSLQMG